MSENSTSSADHNSATTRKVPPHLLKWGLFALVAWMLLFSMGLLIETVEYRILLAPRSVAKQLGVEGRQSLSPTSRELAESASGPLALKEDTSMAIEDAVGRGTDEQPATSESRRSVLTYIHAFVASVLCFTPLNLALLTLVAGLAGGCASNITIETMPPNFRANLQAANPQRMLYLQEPPVSAAIRGFVVFMCVIAGLYIAIEDPFRDPTPAQYIRLAGLLSIMAFMVGYDPSRLDDWLRLVPSPGAASQTQGTPAQPAPPGNPSRLAINQQHMEISMDRITAVTAGGNGKGNVPPPSSTASKEHDIEFPESQKEAEMQELAVDDPSLNTDPAKDETAAI